jgi:hypothetical protein
MGLRRPPRLARSSCPSALVTSVRALSDLVLALLLTRLPVGAPLAGHLSDAALRRHTTATPGARAPPELRLAPALLAGALLVPGSALGAGLVIALVPGRAGIAAVCALLFVHGIGTNMVLGAAAAYGVDCARRRAAEVQAANACVAPHSCGAQGACVLTRDAAACARRRLRCSHPPSCRSSSTSAFLPRSPSLRALGCSVPGASVSSGPHSASS